MLAPPCVTTVDESPVELGYFTITAMFCAPVFRDLIDATTLPAFTVFVANSVPSISTNTFAVDASVPSDPVKLTVTSVETSASIVVGLTVELRVKLGTAYTLAVHREAPVIDIAAPFACVAPIAVQTGAAVGVNFTRTKSSPDVTATPVGDPPFVIVAVTLAAAIVGSLPASLPFARYVLAVYSCPATSTDAAPPPVAVNSVGLLASTASGNV